MNRIEQNKKQEVHSRQLSHTDFVKIVDAANTYYGGNQSWYKPNAIGVNGGCGTVAAANILAYMASTKSRYAKLYPYDINKIRKEDFIQYMNEVYQYITPVKVPEWLSGKTIRNRVVPMTLGVATLGKMARGVKTLAKDRGIDLKVHRWRKFRRVKDAAHFIASALEKDVPVALLNYLNADLSKIEYTSHSGRVSYQNFQMHWVTVTSINKRDGEHPMITVSSWGGKAILNLNDVVSSRGFGGALYFD